MNQQSGYYRFPTIHGDRVVFVCEDDLWGVSRDGGIAVRLTANLGEVSRPFLSPDGQRLAFIGREEGDAEVYCMPATGGTAKRLTFLGASSRVVGWSQDGQSILFASNAAQPFRSIFKLYSIAPAGGMPHRLPLGLAVSLTYGPNGGVALGRNTVDIARWKRYRGGTIGVIWVDPTGSGAFRKLVDLGGNLADPMWVGERIYFISDHEGIGNLYSCNPLGEDLQRHSQSSEYYVRHASTDGRRIIYGAGADLFCFDPAAGSGQPIPIEFHSPRVQRQRKFVDAGEYLESYELHPDGYSTLITARGQSFWFGNWEGAVGQLSRAESSRYRLTCWLHDQQRFVTIHDFAGVENLEIHSSDINTEPERLQDLDLGRVMAMVVSPVANQVVVSNHRHELIWVDLQTQQTQVLDRSDYARIQGACWSPDGRWVAYSCAETQLTFSIKICQLEDKTIHRLTPPRFRDVAPAFDPEGKYIYFLSWREFNPVYDSVYFDLNFPSAMRPFLIALKRETPSPFVPVPKPLQDSKSQDSKSQNQENSSQPVADSAAASADEAAKSDAVPAVEIDLDGIEHRIIGFPVPEGRYRQVWGVKGKVLFSSVPIQGSLSQRSNTKSKAKATIEVYDFEEQKRDTLATEVSNFKVAQDHKTLIYRSRRRLRVCAIDKMEANKKSGNGEPGRKSGWLDLNRVCIPVMPQQEWQQMFQEIWRLQKEHFWTEDLSGVDWDLVYKRYAPLLKRVATRSEFSDLVWEMQGELGTSHAYEIGGDYREEPDYSVGFLGADISYDATADAYQIEHIVQGDAWAENMDSPLHRIGLNIQVGDRLIAVNGQRVSGHLSPQELLVNQAGCEVMLTVASSDSTENRTVTVKTLTNERQARYREWVEANHQKVQAATQGRVGYVHIPDMGPRGYAEFHRYYFAEVHKDALIVDVRYNGGGHVSQLILEKLARQRVGYDIPRWGKPDPYPSDSILGPLVAVTNEYAGSDGDIFSHCFKLMQLGTLIGKRTWGGVIGISPSQSLVDQSIVTQPEYSFWFTDVGWGVENYGTDPDIEVEITPQDWAQGKDPQLDRAIALILEQLDQQAVQLPDFGDRPRLTLPDPKNFQS
ncbi:MAG: peptidase [Cyanothece sp. SIO1E1]|nr:peptidase [Cyanothece sp. SIO1E1]